MTDQKTDSQGRRNRIKPQSTGKGVTPTKRDLLWFSKLHEHGPLPSSFLLAYSKHTHRSEKRAKERLTDLFNENNTPHDGNYLSRPPQQFKTLDARYNQIVYDLTNASRLALEGAGVFHQAGNTSAGPWLHRCMVACITASIELSCLENDRISYIPQWKILQRANADLRYPVSIVLPDNNLVTKDLIPDAIFGLKYNSSHGNRFRFFIVEADRATEPTTSNNFNRKSFKRHLMQYQSYLEGGLYKQHLKLSAPLLVLNVTTDAGRKKRMQLMTGQHFNTGCNYQLFDCWESFGGVFKPPEPYHDLFNRIKFSDKN